MSDFRKPRADHPIYPKSAIYRPTTSRGWIVPKGLKGKKGGKKRKKGKKATYDPETIARVHQQTSRNKERELLQEQLDYRRAQRVVEEEQRIRAAELAEDRRREERARFALEARQMGAQRAFFLQLGNAAAGIAAGVGARAGAAGGAIGGGGGGGALGGGAVGGAAPPAPAVAIPLPDAPRYNEQDLQRGIAQAEERMRQAAQQRDGGEVAAIRQAAAAEVDAARRADRLTAEQAARARAELEQRFAEQMEGLESRARAAEAGQQEAEEQVAAGREQIAQLQQQVLEGQEEQEEALARLRSIAEFGGPPRWQEAAMGLVRQQTAVGSPGEEFERGTAELRTMAQDIQEEQGRKSSGWADATQSLVDGGAFADYGVPHMDETAQEELDQLRQSLVFTDADGRRERQRRTAAANKRWFDFLGRRRIETGARGTLRPKHSPSMEALSAQLALEDLGAQPEPEGQIGGEPRGPTPPPPTEGGGSRPQPPEGRSRGRGGGSRGRSSRKVVSREESETARRELQGIVDKPFLGGGAVPDVQRAIGGERPKEFVPEVGVEPVKPTPRPKTCLLYTSPSPRDGLLSRMPSSA